MILMIVLVMSAFETECDEVAMLQLFMSATTPICFSFLPLESDSGFDLD